MITFLYREYPAWGAILAFLYGLLIGSFLNVCIYRIPKNKSLWTPPSSCQCGRRIFWYDLVPVFSWLLLRGKARCCGAPISWRYPLVEMLTGVLFFCCFTYLEPAKALAGVCLVSILMVGSWIDWDHLMIPDRFTLGGAALGLLLSLFLPAIHGLSGALPGLEALQSFLNALLGLLIGSSVLLWIGIVAYALMNKEAVGFGDVKLLGCIGSFCGWKGALFSIFGGALLGTVCLVPLLALQLLRKKRRGKGALAFGKPIPFGPLLSVAALVYYIFLGPLIDAHFEQMSILFVG